MLRDTLSPTFPAAVALTLALTPGAFAQTGGAPAESSGSEDLRPGSLQHRELKSRSAEQQRPLKAPVTSTCELLTPDFVVTGSSSSSTINEHCFPSDGTGTFGPRSDIPGLAIVDGMDVADLDNDGDNDFLACDGVTGEVYLYTQGPADVFVPSTVATGVTPTGGSFLCTYLRVADFDGNGLPDFVVGDHLTAGGTHVYRQAPAGTFTKVTPGLDLSWASPTGAQCNCLFGIAAGDADGDGNQDIMMLGFNGPGVGQVWFYQGNGNGTMSTPTLKIDVGADFPVVANPTGLALFDVEGDGDLDVVVGGSFDGSHYVYLNDGVANFTTPATSAFTTNNYSGIDAYDVDGDQDHDLMLVDWTSQRLLFSENLGASMAAPTAVGVVDAPSLGVGAPERPEREGFELDHFKCYAAQAEEPVQDKVGLSDQFDAGSAEVFETSRFCNAVAKVHDGMVTPIENGDAHLEFLKIEAVGETPAQVEVTNQFGENQKLEIHRASFLAVPTQKIEPGNHAFPERLDHFKCYDVIGEAVEEIIDLRDQFGYEPEVAALDPRLLCNPTKKEHNGGTTPIENPLDHLVCYELQNTEQQVPFALVRNQFGKRGLHLEQADLLCLPSKKRVIR